MWQKYLIATPVFFLVALLQSSFFAPASLFGVAPNLVFIVFFLCAFLEETKEYSFGLFSAILGGFLLDLFSPGYFGVHIILILVLYTAFKASQVFLYRAQGNYVLLHFTAAFCAVFFFYNVIRSAALDVNMLFVVPYNLAIALVVFYALQKFAKPQPTRQLRLFR